MKICHVITRMIVGGAQENTLFTIKGHLENGHETVLVTGPTEGPEGRLLQHQKLPNLKVEVLENLQREIHWTSEFSTIKELERIFRRESFDVVHTHSSKAGILGRIAAKRCNIPVIVHTVHGQSFHQYQSNFKNRIFIMAERFAAKRCHRIFAVADAMIDQCVEAGIAPRTKYQTVYSGMDLEPYLNSPRDEELAKELNISDDTFVVGKIARLFELKGHKYLIKAAAAVIEEIPNIKFLLIGDGILRQELSDQIEAAGLKDYFIFTGLVDPSEIPRYVGLMDVLVHLSLREGLARTLVQAMAAKVPVVSYKIDGAPEVVIDGETGYLCAPESDLAVSAALVKLYKDPETRKEMGIIGQDFVRIKWDWHTMVTQLEAAYEELLENSQRQN
ncbi:MAG: glycosyltransferase family 4 protein [Lentisphaeria bacterium]|nr:glycosyltransferase family 4 protein [Lentisphaeria bacterium]